MKKGLITLVLAFPLLSFGWGEQGHHSICSAATRLVTNYKAREFLIRRNHMMGHVCNIPDIYWRDMGPIAKSGDDAHFMNPENLKYTLDTVPLNFQEILKLFQGKKADDGHVIDVYADLGSLWWRFNQFYERASSNMKLAAGVENPSSPEKNPEFTKYVFAMMTDMGLMGHFIGDASQPYHNASDYDGWGKGRGGIHSYYESQVVEQLDLDLENLIVKKAQGLPNYYDSDATTPIQVIRKVGIESMAELSKIESVDDSLILEKSRIEKGSDGKDKKIYAKRKKAEEAAPLFKDLIVGQLARSAKALAETWDRLFTQYGSRLNTFAYKSYQYPLAPDFVPLNYGDREPTSVSRKPRNSHRQTQEGR